jgi:hypothetical protein
MLKSAISALTATPILTSQSMAADWESSANMGAQGVNGATASSHQDGLFDLRFVCSAREGENRTIFMSLNTMPDAPLQLGNETEYTVTMLYEFSDDSTKSTDITVEWNREENGGNVWYASFDLDPLFLRNFGQSETLQLLTFDDGLIFTYSMGGSAIAAKTLFEYCYSGNYS